MTAEQDRPTGSTRRRAGWAAALITGAITQLSDIFSGDGHQDDVNATEIGDWFAFLPQAVEGVDWWAIGVVAVAWVAARFGLDRPAKASDPAWKRAAKSLLSRLAGGQDADA